MTPRCTCHVRSDAIGPHTRGCPNHPEYRAKTSCNCSRTYAESDDNPEGHRASCPARPDADYYRAKLRYLLHEKLDEPPQTPCVYCQAQAGEWCAFDCGTPWRILHPNYVSRVDLTPGDDRPTRRADEIARPDNGEEEEE